MQIFYMQLINSQIIFIIHLVNHIFNHLYQLVANVI